MAKKRMDPGPFVIPMPAVLVGAEVDGRSNFMTAAFVGIVNYRPPIVACGLSPRHHTCKGIEQSGVFSLNLPHPEQVEATDWCGIRSGARVDKSQVFETFQGELARAPMIQACRLTAECRLLHTVPFAVDTVYFGEVVNVYVDDAVLHDGEVDWKRIDPLLFTFPDSGYWRLGDWVARAWQVGRDYEAPGGSQQPRS